MSLVDISTLLDYVKHAFVGAWTTALEEAFSQSGNVECVQKFISDLQVPMLVVDRIVTRGFCRTFRAKTIEQKFLLYGSFNLMLS